MKKILFLVVCILSVKIVNADNLNYEYLPYYVKYNENIIQVKKITDNYDNSLFNIDINNYSLSNNFTKYEDLNKKNFGLYFNNLWYFNRITYYSYQDKTDLNYYLTQVLIWNLVSNNNVSICDKFGNILNIYNNDYNFFRNKISNHTLHSNFYNRTYNAELWSSTTFNYYSNNIILDNPNIDGLIITNNNLDLLVYGEKVGNYTINLQKDYEQNNICYNDGTNYYWLNLGEADDLNFVFYYNVYGIKLNIKENLIGVNNRYGDAYLNSKYELYLDSELKLIVDNKDEYVKPNSNYILKDISNNIGINNIDDISFKVFDEEYNLIIDKYVMSKNISVEILDNNNYYIYLKSNNELYEKVNSDTSLVTLPYGIYYITDNANFYQEIHVLDDIDYVLKIDNTIKEEIPIIEEVKEEISVVEEKDEIIIENNNLSEEIIIDNPYVDEVIDNPRTGYNYSIYIYILIINIILLSLLLVIKRKKR